jgi:hypothetical protein
MHFNCFALALSYIYKAIARMQRSALRMYRVYNLAIYLVAHFPILCCGACGERFWEKIKINCAIGIQLEAIR